MKSKAETGYLFGDDSRSDVPSSKSNDRLKFLLLGLLIVAALALVFGFLFHLDLSWSVVAFTIVGTAGVVTVSRMPRLGAIILVLMVAVVGVVLMETDNVLQYGTMRLWGAPPVIHVCGVSMYPGGDERSLSNGDAPPLQHIWTTPAGVYVWGYAGCPDALNEIIVTWNGRFITYVQSP
jgi:hypothetical protein